MSGTLSKDQAAYLLALLKEHVEYYRLLAGQPKCSARNKEACRFVVELWAKVCALTASE